jgi:hypothetical protein
MLEKNPKNSLLLAVSTNGENILKIENHCVISALRTKGNDVVIVNNKMCLLCTVKEKILPTKYQKGEASNYRVISLTIKIV